MGKTRGKSAKNPRRGAKRRWHLAVVVGLLIAGIAFGITTQSWRILSPAKRANSSRSLGQPPNAPVPDPSHPSKEYIYGGGKLIATESGKSDQTITFNSIPNKSYGDAPFSLSATASSGLAVSFSIVSGPATISGSTVSITGVGTVTVRASQAGDGSYNAAANVDQSFTVAKASQTITFNTIGNKTYGDGNYNAATNDQSFTVAKASQTITFNALGSKIYGDASFSVSSSASSGLAVSFSIISGPATISGSTVSITGAGTVTVRASQAGDGNYNAATNVDQSFTVAKASQTITFNALGSKTYGDAPFSVSGSASSGLAVSFSIVSGPATISGSTVSITAIGTITVRASQAGDGNYNAATNIDQSFSVAKATPIISWTPPTEMVYGIPLSSIQLNATASINGNAVAGGFSYSPAAGTILTIGSQVLQTSFTPVDTANVNSVPFGNVQRHINVISASRSMSFDGSSGYLEAPNSASLNVTGPTITLEAWVKMPNPASGSYQSILEKAPASSTEGGYDLCVTDQGKARIDVYFGTAYLGVIGNTVLSANTWHNIAGVYTGSQLQVYVDGLLDGSYTYSTTITPTSASLMIGRVHFPYGPQYFNGLIDEVRLSPTVLYTGTFTAQKSLTASSSTNGLWKFNGQTTIDSSGNGNNGTLNGGASYSTDVPH